MPLREDATMPAATPYRFPTTHWSLIGKAGEEDQQGHAAALNELLARYWPALKAHLVYRRGVEPHAADDLVQGFIENRILERRLVASADQQRGKFRTLLATALDNYAKNQWERAAAKKRSADRAATGENEWNAAAANTLRPPDEFDRQWARQVLAETLDRMQAEYEVRGNQHAWSLFYGRIVAPILTGAKPVDYREIVRDGKFASPAQASNSLMTAKRAFARILREVVSQYAADRDDVETEIAELQRALANTR